MSPANSDGEKKCASGSTTAFDANRPDRAKAFLTSGRDRVPFGLKLASRSASSFGSSLERLPGSSATSLGSSDVIAVNQKSASSSDIDLGMPARSQRQSQPYVSMGTLRTRWRQLARSN